MKFEEFIGFRLEDIKSELEKSGTNYKIIEVFDTKKTKIGNDIRIINVKNDNDNVKIYVAYF
ncbi:hypothetical protein SAMN05443428_107164 [Caloramator quimbayensis]|uniref:Uncharacterized protein n=1 Tax=Caloramator quimbayensis TaxID=1147123 RepID=A0A1T4XCC1_9CLOT|nr:hypothetical protein [Caloramator quimbayensis]SKA87057.1 hypothetical protein SAMN05443428_107164 [Caloramator quimbayensis]